VQALCGELSVLCLCVLCLRLCLCVDREGLVVGVGLEGCDEGT
jgi:hypothetical protein